MKKFLGFIFIILILLIAGAYTLLFTSFGNSFVTPYIEKNISKYINADIKVTEFKLRPSFLSLKATLNNNKFLSVNGTFGIFNRNIDIDYDVNVDDMNVLTKDTKVPLSGKLTVSGNAKGKLKDFDVKGNAVIADGKINYLIKILNYNPKNLETVIQNVKLEQILQILNKPVYSFGNLFAKVNINNLMSENISGKINMNIQSGKTNPEIIEKEFNIKDAVVKYNLNGNININGSIADIESEFKSNIANLDIFDAKANIKSGDVHGKYKIVADDLDELYFLTNTHLKGGAVVTGDFKKDKDLKVNAHSNIFDGKFDAHIINDKLTAEIRKVQVVKVLEMLIYPKIFDSEMNADIKYNLLSKKGTVDAKLHNGRILPNKLSFILKNMAKFDITKEIYKITTIKSNINDKEIYTDLFMESRLTKITSRKAYLNMQENKINADLNIFIMKKPVIVKIKGDVKKPKINVDFKDFLKSEVKSKAEKEIKKFIPKDKAKDAEKIFNLIK